MKRKATRKAAKALTPVPPKIRKRVGGFVHADTVAIVDESKLPSDLRSLIESARQRIASAANATATILFWSVGRRLLRESLQGGRGAYGKQILATVLQVLTAEFGAGFSYPALTRKVRFAEWMTNERILATLSQELNWSHFMELLPIKEPRHGSSTQRCAASSAGTCAPCGRSQCCRTARSFAELTDRDHPDEEMLSVTITKGIVPHKALLEGSSKKDSSNLVVSLLLADYTSQGAERY